MYYNIVTTFYIISPKNHSLYILTHRQPYVIRNPNGLLEIPRGSEALTEVTRDGVAVSGIVQEKVA